MCDISPEVGDQSEISSSGRFKSLYDYELQRRQISISHHSRDTGTCSVAKDNRKILRKGVSASVFETPEQIIWC